MNTDVRADIVTVHKMLSEAIGERDPERVQEILRKTMPVLMSAVNGSWMMEEIFTDAAKRGEYKKDGGAD